MTERSIFDGESITAAMKAGEIGLLTTGRTLQAVRDSWEMRGKLEYLWAWKDVNGETHVSANRDDKCFNYYSVAIIRLSEGGMTRESDFEDAITSLEKRIEKNEREASEYRYVANVLRKAAGLPLRYDNDLNPPPNKSG